MGDKMQKEINEILLKNFDKQTVNNVILSKKYSRLYYGDVQNIDINLCKTLYESYKLPIYKIAMLYGIDDVTMRKKLISANTKMRGHYVGKNSENHYFQKIDSYDKAYFLGLLVADGNIINLSNKKKTKKRISIDLTFEDGYILELFNKYANLKTELLLCHRTDEKPRLRIAIYSKVMYDNLVELGLQDKKSKLGTIMPDIQENLIPHFIRGYFDGDGIAFSSGYVGFCGSKELLTSIRDYLVNNGLSFKNVYYNKQNGIYYLQWSAINDRKKFVNIIYKDKNDLFLKRKYEKILDKLT